MILTRRRNLAFVSAVVLTFAACFAKAQGPRIHGPSEAAYSSSADQQPEDSTPEGGTVADRVEAGTAAHIGDMPISAIWRHPGVGLHVGVNGIGVDIAEPLGEHFNVREGGEFFRYTGDFTSDGAQIHADLTVGGGHLALDYFPWHNGFHISPQLRFAVQTAANVKVVVPPGQQITLDGTDYVSSASDPLRGAGYVDTRKVAPGITVGYGNLIPRSGAHWSFPVEVGFYYVGQPNLNVTFTGSACDPSEPPSIGCQSVDSDPGFQNDLKNFIARQKHNVSYASVFPVASFGLGYRF